MPRPVRTVLNVLRMVRARYVQFGAGSAWVCLETFARNFGVKLRNRICRAPRAVCPVCGWQGAGFLALDIGHRVLAQVECPGCHTHDRHRLLTLAWERKGLAPRAGARALHCAPEPAVRMLLDAAALRVISTDISIYPLKDKPAPRAAADGQALPFADASLDLVVSLHVLEHVPDDRRAIREYYRVLRPGGKAIIMAPMLDWIPATEDWGKPDPQMFDHYRTYSTHDAAERFQPFRTRIYAPDDVLSPEERRRHRVRTDEYLLVCEK